MSKEVLVTNHPVRHKPRLVDSTYLPFLSGGKSVIFVISKNMMPETSLSLPVNSYALTALDFLLSILSLFLCLFFSESGLV